MFRTNFTEKIRTLILHSVFFSPEYHTFYYITWKNIAERGRPQMTIWSMRIACWI